MNYYFQQNNEILGPVSLDDLVKLIDLNCLVKTEDDEVWKIAQDIPEVLKKYADKSNSVDKKTPPPIPVKKNIPPAIQTHSYVSTHPKTGDNTHQNSSVNKTLTTNTPNKKSSLKIALFVIAIILGAIFYLKENKQSFSTKSNIENHKNNSDEADVSEEKANTTNNNNSSSERNSNSGNQNVIKEKRKEQCAYCQGKGSKKDKPCDRCVFDYNGHSKNSGGYVSDYRDRNGDHFIPCPECNGTGLVEQQCSVCNGKGYVEL